MLEGFSPFSFGNTGPYMSVTKNGVTFNKIASEKLGKPANVLLLINHRTAQLAIKKAAANDPSAVPFCDVIKKGAPSVRWNSKELLREICSMTGWVLDAPGCTGYKVFAQYDKPESALIFDLNSAVPNA